MASPASAVLHSGAPSLVPSAARSEAGSRQSHSGVDPACLAACFDCYRGCFAMACSLDGTSHVRQAALLLDCAELCRTLTELALRGSPYARHLAAVCDDACRVAASICRQYDDSAAIECAQVCGECALACAIVSEAG